MTAVLDSPSAGRWTVPCPPIPDWLPETVGFLRPGGEWNDFDSRIEFMRSVGLDMETAERRNRLAAVHAAGRVLPLWESKNPGRREPRACLEAVEAWAEGGSRKKMYDAAWSSWHAAATAAAGYARTAGYAGYAGYAVYAVSAGYARTAERLAQSRLLTLSLPVVAWSDRWESPTAAGIAEAVYQLRDFARMPILADALEDAGCDDPVVLRWLRELPAYCWFRGCWILDKLTGRLDARPAWTPTGDDDERA